MARMTDAQLEKLIDDDVESGGAGHGDIMRELWRARASEARLIEALKEFVRLVEEFGKGWDETDWPVAIDHLKKQAEAGRAALKEAESNG